LAAAAWRFVGLWVLISLIAGFYRIHPYYRRPWFEPWQWALTYAYTAFCVCGVWYLWATSRWRRQARHDFSDPALLVLSCGRQVWRALRLASWAPLRCYWRAHRVHHLLRSVTVKAFFLPLMVVFLSLHTKDILRLWATPRGEMVWVESMNWGMSLIFQSIFFCDTVVGAVGYGCESAWLKNRTRSVDHTWSGWIVCLMCYPPFNDITQIYAPLGAGANEMGWSEMTLLMLRGMSLVCYGVYVWATFALGVHFSNLSNKGIVERGPYRWIRHPAYISKNLAWWCEQLPGMVGFLHVIPMLTWNVIYLLRGLTEERHLRSDPDYRAYCGRVRSRFIPGVW
jgi:protein-S-isoprenylcysteine O-methyltransferase Ste14